MWEIIGPEEHLQQPRLAESRLGMLDALLNQYQANQTFLFQARCNRNKFRHFSSSELTYSSQNLDDEECQVQSVHCLGNRAVYHLLQM